MLRALALVAVAASTLAAQPVAVRTRVGPSSAPWLRAALTPAPADSFDLALRTSGLVLRTTQGALAVQRDIGVNRKRGALIGFVVGAGAFTIASLSEGGAEVLTAPGLYGYAGAFGLAGAAYGAMLMPRSWEPYSTPASPCGGYRFAPGSTVTLSTADGQRVSGAVRAHTVDSLSLDGSVGRTEIATTGASVELPPIRDRVRGAVLWGLGTLLITGWSYSIAPADQKQENLNAMWGLGSWAMLLGAAFGPKREQLVPLPRC